MPVAAKFLDFLAFLTIVQLAVSCEAHWVVKNMKNVKS